MNNSVLVLETLRALGAAKAAEVQQAAPDMDDTTLNSKAGFIPDFAEAVKVKNMLERKAGFVCKSPAGRVVKLIQPYDSETYGSDPEQLPAQWGFVWSNDPAHAREFIALATSPYNTGNVCKEAGTVYRSNRDGVVHAPSVLPEAWEAV